MSLQQNSKLYNKFKGINTKNAVLLDSYSNTTIICNKNHAECAQDANNKIPAETNSGLISTQ